MKDHVRISEDSDKTQVRVTHRDTEFLFIGNTLMEAVKDANRFARSVGAGMVSELQEAISNHNQK